MKKESVDILHALPGRIRLRLQRLKQNGKFAERIHAQLPAIPGVDLVDANPETGNVLIEFDEQQSASLSFHLAVAQVLEVSPTDFDPDQMKPLLNGHVHELSEGRHNGVGESQETLPAVPPNLLESTYIIHAIEGRVRLRVPLLKTQPGLADTLTIFLQDQQGLTDISVNASCASVAVYYERHCWSAEKICQFIQSQCYEDIESYSSKRVEVLPSASPADEPAGDELWYSSIGIGIALVAEPLAVPVLPVLLFAGAWPMLKRAYHSISVENKLNVDVLDASATTVLVVQGNFPMATFMVFLINIADFIRDLTVMQSKKAIEEVLSYRTNEAWVIRNGQKIRVPVVEIEAGEIVMVYPGERITVDGTVQTGKAMVDQATLTGESLPVIKNPGDPVYAATVVCEGEMTVQADQIGDETEAARIVRLVEDAPARETKIQNYAVKWANDLVPYSFMGSAMGAVMGGGLQGAAAVLIVDYGTGIRIAAPTTVLSSMTKAIRRGILIKGGRHLENLAEIDAVVFDKTGTLTSGRPDVVDIIPVEQFTEEELLTFAAAAENRLTHPVAHAIVQAAEVRGLKIPERTTSDYQLGMGVESMVEGRTVLVGNRRFMQEKRVTLDTTITRQLQEMQGQAVSPLCVAVDGTIIGLISYADPVRPEAKDVVRAIKERGIEEIVMLTGDHEQIAKQVCQDLGISRYIAEAFPGQKAEVVQELQRQGRKVAVIGDGINDSPALAYADVGIAVDGGTQVAQATAHVVLLHGGLWKIPAAIDIGREAVNLIQQNWKIISIPNTFALGLACLGLLGPIGATLLSNGSAIVATANALRPIMQGKPEMSPPKLGEH